MKTSHPVTILTFAPPTSIPITALSFPFPGNSDDLIPRTMLPGYMVCILFRADRSAGVEGDFSPGMQVPRRFAMGCPDKDISNLLLHRRSDPYDTGSNPWIYIDDIDPVGNDDVDTGITLAA